MVEPRSAFEEYCEAIFELREDDLDVIQARIAERLNVSRPAVSEMIRRLAADGLVTMDDGIALTAKGMVLAERVVRRRLTQIRGDGDTGRGRGSKDLVVVEADAGGDEHASAY